MFGKKRDLEFDARMYSELGRLEGIVLQQSIEIERLKRSVDKLNALYSKK